MAPDFTLPDQNGKMHTLSSYRGQRVALYFIQKMKRLAVPKKPVAFVMVINNLKMRVS